MGMNRDGERSKTMRKMKEKWMQIVREIKKKRKKNERCL